MHVWPSNLLLLLQVGSTALHVLLECHPTTNTPCLLGLLLDAAAAAAPDHGVLLKLLCARSPHVRGIHLRQPTAMPCWWLRTMQLGNVAVTLGTTHL
jgi:hypothetical protein